MRRFNFHNSSISSSYGAFCVLNTQQNFDNAASCAFSIVLSLFLILSNAFTSNAFTSNILSNGSSKHSIISCFVS